MFTFGGQHARVPCARRKLLGLLFLMASQKTHLAYLSIIQIHLDPPKSDEMTSRLPFTRGAPPPARASRPRRLTSQSFGGWWIVW